MKSFAIWRIFLALGLAVIAGCLTGPETSVFDVKLLQIYGIVGQLFLNALTLIVVPMVCSSIIIATARMGADAAFKTLGIRSFVYFIATTLVAMCVGYALITFFQPGGSLGGVLAQGAIPIDEARLQELQGQAGQGAFEKVEQILVRLVPKNIFDAAAEGQVLGLITFCTLFGFFASKIEPRTGAVVIAFFQGISQIMMKITQLVIRLLPIGVFALVAKVIAVTGLEAIKSVAVFFSLVVAGLVITCFVIFSFWLWLVAKVSPFHHFKALMPALLTAFSTSSSAAALPVSIDCLEKNGYVAPRICDFFMPLATAINMPGTALHVCAAVFFISQVYGVSFNLMTQGIILLMTLLTSFGVAGVPSGSLFAVVTVLGMVGLPGDGILLILAVERLLDMCRTAANVYINSCCAVLIGRAEKQEPAIVSAVSAT